MEWYGYRKFGLVGAELAAIARFFEQPWSRISTELSEVNRAWLLSSAAFYLHRSGRLTEALNPTRQGLRHFEVVEHWAAASVSATNLSELELTLGAVPAAVANAERSLEFADRSEDAFWRMAIRAKVGTVFHQAGRRADALACFREAEAMQAERQPSAPLLFSLQGFNYCDLLLAGLERAAWQRVLHPAGNPALPARQGVDAKAIRSRPTSAIIHLLKRGRTVEQRVTQTIKWGERKGYLLDIALDHLTLGRVALYRAAIETPFDQRFSAHHLTSAVNGFHAAGLLDELPRGLLTRSWLNFLAEDAIGAQADLDEACEIAERGPMRLHQADIHLHRARLFFRERRYPWKSPLEDLDSAERLIKECGYHRRDQELADAKKVVG